MEVADAIVTFNYFFIRFHAVLATNFARGVDVVWPALNHIPILLSILYVEGMHSYAVRLVFLLVVHLQVHGMLKGEFNREICLVSLDCAHGRTDSSCGDGCYCVIKVSSCLAN